MAVHPIIQELIAEIDDFVKAKGLTATEFGLQSINDPNLYGDLKNGRSPRLSTIDRVRAFMAPDEVAA